MCLNWQLEPSQQNGKQKQNENDIMVMRIFQEHCLSMWNVHFRIPSVAQKRSLLNLSNGGPGFI